MTEFKPNITESIDNLNQANSNINVLNEKFKDVYSDETADFIDQVLEDNIDTQAGTSLELNNTVDKGKMEYKAKGDTYQQTYTGKNLIALDEINLSANSTTDLQLGKNLPIETYTFDGENMSGDGRFNLVGVDLDDTQENVLTNELTKNIKDGYSFTTTKIYKAIIIYTNVALSGKIQLESGSTKTSWEPYVGGIPAPNPDYPQDIKVVTGENTVTISNSDNSKSQEITVDLKTTELCKIGDYQDYIYGTKDNWKLVKQINKIILDGTEDYTLQSINQYDIANFKHEDLDDYKNDIQSQIICNYFSPQTSLISTTTTPGIMVNTNKNLFIRIQKAKADTVSNFQTWLNTHNTIAYYVLAESTETAIEDEDIIDNLNDLYDATFYAEQTNIAVTNETDLPLILDVTYFVTEKEE